MERDSACPGHTTLNRQSVASFGLRQSKASRLTVFASQVSEAVASAALFLKQLQVLEILRNGRLYSRFRREDGGDGQIMVEDHQNNLIIWNIFHANFETTADRLRSYYPIEKEATQSSTNRYPGRAVSRWPVIRHIAQRDATVVAVSHRCLTFFPLRIASASISKRATRTRNKAAIEAAAVAVAHNLKRLPDMLGHVGLWRFIEQLDATRQATERGTQNTAFATFWREIAPLLSKSAVVGIHQEPGSNRQKLASWRAKLNKRRNPSLRGWEFLSFHPELRRFYGLMRQSGVPLLSVDDVVAGLAKVKMVSGIPIAEAPAGLRDSSSWNLLWKALDAIQNRRPQSQETID